MELDEQRYVSGLTTGCNWASDESSGPPSPPRQTKDEGKWTLGKESTDHSSSPPVRLALEVLKRKEKNIRTFIRRTKVDVRVSRPPSGSRTRRGNFHRRLHRLSHLFSLVNGLRLPFGPAPSLAFRRSLVHSWTIIAYDSPE